MTELDVKIALQNYHKLKKSIKAIENKIEYIEVKQTRTGGSVIKMPEGSPNNEQYKLGLIEQKERYLKDLDHHQYYLSLADDFIKSLPRPYGTIVRNKYVDKVRLEVIAEVYGYHRNSITYIIDRLIKRYIDET
jgi:hypothetical protein